jgi:hypothetical protein
MSYQQPPPNNDSSFYQQPTGAYGQPQQYPSWGQQPPPRPPKKSRRRLWIILSIIGGILIFSCATCGIVAAFTPATQQAAQPTQAPIIAVATATPTQAPTPTSTPTPKPTATPTPKPTQHPAPTPTPKPHCVGVNNNPWCYDFNPGKLIYIPPNGFCNYFNCIATFYASDDPGDGYIIECSDSTFSQSGGESGACSHHGGEMRPLYSH